MMVEKRMKVPAGKLLVLKAEVEGNRIVQARLEGDFFLHPEEKLEVLEAQIPALSQLGEQEMAAGLAAVARKEGIQLVGLTPEAIAALAMQALGGDSA